MRERLEVGTFRVAHVQVIDAGHLHVHAAGGRDLQPVQPVQLVHGAIAKRAEQLAVDGEPELVQAECDGQLELLVNEERKAAVALLGTVPAEKRASWFVRSEYNE